MVFKIYWTGPFYITAGLLTTNSNRGNMYEVNENILSIVGGGIENDFIGRYSGNGICC